MIITVSREFGSGGRELGKRLSDFLGYDYYDKEIISRIADETGLQEHYIEQRLEQGNWRNTPLAFRRSFSAPHENQSVKTELLVRQTKIIREIAKSSRDFVIVGRCADVILKQYAPINLFVYADMPSKIRRCLERADDRERLSEAEITKKIKEIDAERAGTRAIISGGKWGRKEGYHLMINTTDLEINALAPVVADFARLHAGGNR